MIVYRLIQEKYSPDWDGKGAELIGRRWNSKGVPMIYTSESRALCTAEIAVHIALGSAPAEYILLTINISENIEISEIDLKLLPQGWRKFPFDGFTRKLGDEFILQNQVPVMKVPSAAIPGDFNYLINPHHPDFKKIKIIKSEPYDFDERFFNR